MRCLMTRKHSGKKHIPKKKKKKKETYSLQQILQSKAWTKNGSGKKTMGWKQFFTENSLKQQVSRVKIF